MIVCRVACSAAVGMEHRTCCQCRRPERQHIALDKTKGTGPGVVRSRVACFEFRSGRV